MSNQQNKEQLDAIIGGNPISVIYQPELSLGLRIEIAANITPSMVSLDGESSQYTVESVCQGIENADISHSEVTEEDEKILEAIKALSYHFIEL